MRKQGKALKVETYNVSEDAKGNRRARVLKDNGSWGPWERWGKVRFSTMKKKGVFGRGGFTGLEVMGIILCVSLGISLISNFTSSPESKQKKKCSAAAKTMAECRYDLPGEPR